MALAYHSDVLWLEACEHYQKGSFRNRCHIAGPNGLQRLSIPLRKGKHQQTPIREVRIAYDEPWQQVHWRSIQAAYGNAPYFEHFAADLERVYQKRFSFLFDLNQEMLHFLVNNIGLIPEIRLTSAFRPKFSGEPGSDSTDFRDTILPGVTPLPPWFRPIPYPQVFSERHGFLPAMSALDLFFCCGKQSVNILQQSLFPQYF